MKAGLKQMKKEYKKINIDKVEDLQVSLLLKWLQDDIIEVYPDS